MARDYKREYKQYHGKPKNIKKRSARNKARRKMGYGVGDPREVQHVRPLSKGGGNGKSNLRATTKAANRKEGGRLTEGELIAFVKERIAHFKSPKHVTFVDALPKTGTGKIMKQALKQR